MSSERPHDRHADADRDSGNCCGLKKRIAAPADVTFDISQSTSLAQTTHLLKLSWLLVWDEWVSQPAFDPLGAPACEIGEPTDAGGLLILRRGAENFLCNSEHHEMTNFRHLTRKIMGIMKLRLAATAAPIPRWSSWTRSNEERR
jgi:hypothetical protein